MSTNPWFSGLRRWLREQREMSEVTSMSLRERRDAGISAYDLEWLRRRGPRRF